MAPAIGGPRVLLRRLRAVMAEPVSPQERLDKIVVQIAQNMVAEVCSAYVLREDGALELYATEGLNREAVHLTTMKAGEGLVGLIAREAQPLALQDACWAFWSSRTRTLRNTPRKKSRRCKPSR
jgi:phosphotransferase system, enzyme I, PtsP